MSDESVKAALRSGARLVVIDAPAGCGKTHSGAEYARELAGAGAPGRPLILTHTHAACSVFAERTREDKARVDIRTIDSLISQIASAYHRGIGLPCDIAAWVRGAGEHGHQELALKTAKLLRARPMIAAALARRHPTVICDEHQDSNGDQHAVVMALHEQGARLRIFGDPVQKIFRDKKLDGCSPPCNWSDLWSNAEARDELGHPHRWDRGCKQLGQWALAARKLLRNGGKIDLRHDLPPSVQVVVVENVSPTRFGFVLSPEDRKPIDVFQKAQSSLLILTHYNDTAKSLRAFFNGSISLWEGHTRSGLDRLVRTIPEAKGNPEKLAASVVEFMGEVGVGFSPSAFGETLLAEAKSGCAKARKGKPGLIQALARHLVDSPDHRGVARLLENLADFIDRQDAFSGIRMDGHKEFWEAVRLGQFETPEVGLAEITNRRTYSRPKPHDRAISIIHKAKGLECQSAIVVPCDSQSFPDKPDARCLLYVALTRASRNLMLVVSKTKPSPLFIL